jgi:WD40 repeat protein
MALTRASGAALAAALILAFAAAAHASFIVYGCGNNLCRINPDGTGSAPVTTDGGSGASAYGAPSLSRDGSRLAFIQGSNLYIGDAAAQNRVGPISTYALTAMLRPDGGQVADIESFSSSAAVCVFNADGSGRNCPYSTGSAGWAPDNGLLFSVSAGAPNYNQEICHGPVSGTSGACSDVRANDPANDLYDPAVSPDGSTLAVTVAANPAVSGHIALYNYATGQFERNLTSGTTDELPAWSPDGTKIAFQRDSGIYVIGVGDPAGSEHQLVAGTQPTWGGPPDGAAGPPPPGGGSGGSTLGPSPLKLHASKPHGGLAKGVPLRLSCPAACHAAITALIPKSLAKKLHIARTALVKVGSAHATLTKAGSKTVKVKLSKKALKRLKHAHGFKLTLKVAAHLASGQTITGSTSIRG